MKNEIQSVLAERYALATKSARIGLWEYDIVEQKLVWDDIMFELYCVERSDFDGANHFWKNRIHPEDLEKAVKEVQQAITEEKDFNTEFRVVWPDGMVRYIRAKAKVFRDNTGNALRMIGANWDITKEKLAEDLLKEREHINRIFIEQAPTAIAMFDMEMKYLAVSKKWIEDYQLEGVELIGRSHYEIFPEIGEDWKKIHRDCLKGQVNTSKESRFIRHDASVQYLSWEIRPWYLTTGKIGGLLMYTEDITQRKEDQEKLRLSEEWFRGAFDYSAVGLAIAGMDGSWIKVNQRFCQIVGYSLMELEPLTFKDITHPDDLQQNLNLLQELLAGKRQSYKLEKRYFHKKGHIVWVQLIVSMVKDTKGDPLHLVAVMSDITAKKNAEEKMEKYARTLEQKNKELQQFTYISSHDLKEPLNTIISLLNILKEESYDEFSPDIKQLFDFIGNSATRMNNLIEGLLEYNRMDGQVTMASVDMSSLVSEVVSDLQASVGKSGAEIEVEELPVVKGNEVQLGILYQNLISNAIKFKKPGEPLKIKIGVKTEGNSRVFYVSDNGIGIASKHHDRIFQIFQRLHAKELYEGTGLGLATCAKVVLIHEGDIWVESTPDNGALFYFTLGVN